MERYIIEQTPEVLRSQYSMNLNMNCQIQCLMSHFQK